MTKKEFKAVMDRVWSYYPNFKDNFTGDLFNLWYARLGDYEKITQTLLERAVDRYVDNNRFPPQVCDLRQLAIDIYQEDYRKERAENWRKSSERIDRDREREKQEKIRRLLKAQ